MVGVEVGEEDLLEVDQADRAQELALGALAAVEQQPVAAAADERRGQPALRRGRRAGGSEEQDVQIHGPILTRARSARQSSRMSSNDTRPPSTLARPIVCPGARRRSVGLPGLKIWKPPRPPRGAAGASARTRRRRRGRRSAGAAARGGRRAGRRRGASPRAPRPPPPPAPPAAARAARRVSTLPWTAATGGPIASSSRSVSRVFRSPAWSSRSAASIRSTHASGRRRAPRGRWVSEITAISMCGLDWPEPAPVAQWIERCPPEAEVAGSNPAGRVK